MFPYNSIIWPTYAVGNMTYLITLRKVKKKTREEDVVYMLKMGNFIPLLDGC